VTSPLPCPRISSSRLPDASGRSTDVDDHPRTSGRRTTYRLGRRLNGRPRRECRDRTRSLPSGRRRTCTCADRMAVSPHHRWTRPCRIRRDVSPPRWRPAVRRGDRRPAAGLSGLAQAVYLAGGLNAQATAPHPCGSASVPGQLLPPRCRSSHPPSAVDHPARANRDDRCVQSANVVQ
jgi:hypothetical protein